jgi:hypothetical protein
LTQLPSGKWVGGTAANFVAANGGTTDKEHIFFTDITDHCEDAVVLSYSSDELKNIGADYADNGYAVLIVPGLSEIHSTFAKEISTYDGIFNTPLVGWVSGVLVSEIGVRIPKSFAGSAEALTDRAAALIVTLPQGTSAQLDIVNLFTQGDGSIITFENEGFSTEGTVLIDGQKMNLASYLAENKIDTKLPLVADYNGANINVSIQSVDEENGTVQFYAPVFKDTEYRFAKPIADYTKEFDQAVDAINTSSVAFSCNCILNFLYADLEGKKTGPFVGPITFGEIAYILLNQTLVYLSIVKSD